MSQIRGKFIGFLGPLGSGKSTIAQVLAEKLKAGFVIQEPYHKNPFWSKSQTDPRHMLASQIYFLQSNIISDMLATKKAGISISDTSTLTDILMWVPWYRHTGHLSKEEFRLYNKLVMLLKPQIPRPDLMVIIFPASVSRLKQGVANRAKNEPRRQGELVFSGKKSHDLSFQCKIVAKLVKILNRQWKIKTVSLKIDPLTIMNDKNAQKRALKKIIDILKS